MWEEDQYPTTTYPYNNCLYFCHHLPNQYIMHSPTSSGTLLHMPSTPFPNFNATFPSLSTLQNSSNHSLTPQFSTHHPTTSADLSQIPHNPPGNEPHPPLLCYHLKLVIASEIEIATVEIGMAAAVARAALDLRASSRQCSNSSCSDIIKRNKLGFYLEKEKS